MIRLIAAATLLSVAALSSATSPAFAVDSCRPTRDGKDRIATSGGGCPDGYTIRGACCESLRAISQSATGAKTCPAGTMVRLGVCVPRQ